MSFLQSGLQRRLERCDEHSKEVSGYMLENGTSLAMPVNFPWVKWHGRNKLRRNLQTLGGRVSIYAEVMVEVLESANVHCFSIEFDLNQVGDGICC